LQDAYRDLGYPKGTFPVTERLSAEILSLPLFPELSAKQIEYVLEALAAFPVE
jgi:dTDP-4-amino-4,6-dideoxygalactose transaminase